MKILRFLKNIIFSRITLAILSLILQILLIVVVFFYFSKSIILIFGGFGLLSTLIVLLIINSKANPSYKIAWIIPLLLFPILGVFIYLFFKLQISVRLMKKKLITNREISSKYLKQNSEVLANIKDKSLSNLAIYTNKISNYPIYPIENIEFFESGLLQFKDMIEELKKAQEYIFLEYFIMEKGYMFNTILNILKEKAKNGIEIRIMYDGFGSLLLLNRNFCEEMEKFNIKCKIFSPIKPVISAHHNYRDHRKICIIDGRIAYTGGVNIADEYINMKERFGYWKDSGIKVKGSCVNSFITMFLELWNIEDGVDEYQKYIKINKNEKNNGYIIPYGDSPLDEYEIGRRIYLDILNSANDYVYITTPYLILDDEMVDALNYAALRGVDVRIVMPSIPDKKMVYYLGRSYYYELIKAGVKIYEYKYGFTHSKMFISDDIKAVVGTINLDYRSLYLHFECASFIYNHKVVKDIKKDYMDTINNSNRILIEDIKKYSLVKRIIGRILRFMAPLM